MNLLACRYAVVQFLPYAETGEFANVGIVLLCPETGYFDFRLQDHRRTRRITQFFDRLDRSIFMRSIKHFQQELQRVAQYLDADVFTKRDADTARSIFDTLTHPREAIIRFAPSRALLTTDPANELDTLFARYVEHEFATPEHREAVLEKRIGELLRGLLPDTPFREKTLGNDETHARFPFVLMSDGQPVKAIKPLFLAQGETHKIYEHADYWLSKMRRLHARGLLPQATLVSTEAPKEDDTKRYKAFSEIRDELRGLGLETAAANDDLAIRQFALSN